MSLSEEETRVSAYLFGLADTEQLGVLTGDKAVAFLSKSRLPIEVLGEVWQVADSENNGFLTPERFGTAWRLIAHAQQGESIKPELANKPAPTPMFEGVSIPGVQPQTASQPAALSPVSTQDKTRFIRLFLQAGPSNGLLDGDKARDILIKSNLPYAQLGQIWTLADTKQRGALDATDFVIGMHLVDLTMSGQLPGGQLPDTLPPGLYESAIVPSATSGSQGPASPIQPQSTGGGAPRGSILKPQSTGDRPIPRQHTGQKVSFTAAPSVVPSAWDVSAAEKQRSDGFFDQLDVHKRGVVEGDSAVPFFLESQLPEATLAQVWDLSDVTKSGSLNKDEFAVAMRLINDQLDGQALPTELPASMIPPSLRQGQAQQQQQQPAQPPVEKDLFSLMDDPEPQPAAQPPAALSPQGTGASASAQPQAAGQGTPRAALSPQGTGNQSFVAAGAGAAVGGAAAAAAAPVASPPAQQPQQFASRSGSTADDFFGDDGAKSVSQDSAQLGQLRNEYNASSKGADTFTAQREEMQSASDSTASEIADLKEKLKVSRETYEREQKTVQDLSLRAGEQKKELQKAKEELIRAESELSGLKDEKRETEGGLLRDKEEIRNLKAKLAEVSKETVALRTAVDKFKKDGRQQKGMLAISKKQLATAEADEQKAKQELEQAKAEPPAEAFTASPEPAARSLPTSNVASPAQKSTNPFDRFMHGGGKPMSPQLTGTSSQKALSPQPIGASSSKASPFGQSAPLPLPGQGDDSQGLGGVGGVAAGLGLGAAAAGTAGVVAAKSGSTEQSPEAKPDSLPQQPQAGDNHTEEDPFAPAGESKDDPFESSAGNTGHAIGSSFDDQFDNSFAEHTPANDGLAASAGAAAEQPSGFDDAFSDVDKTAATGAVPPAAAQQQPEPDTAGAERFPPVETGSATAMPVVGGPKQGESDAESSADEGEGPEDLDQPRASTMTPHLPGAYADSAEVSQAPSESGLPPPVTSDVPAAPSSSADAPAVPAQSPSAPVTSDLPPPPAKSASSDFDNDFVDLAPSARAEGGQVQADDKFDDDFNMDDFGSDGKDDAFGVPASSSAAAGAPAGTSSGFDDAFAGDSFAPSAPAPTTAVSSAEATEQPNKNGSAFDDFDKAFEPPPTAPVPNPPAPAASPALATDSPDIQELSGMGFSRTAVMDALRSNNNDRQRALNALLDMGEGS